MIKHRQYFMATCDIVEPPQFKQITGNNGQPKNVCNTRIAIVEEGQNNQQFRTTLKVEAWGDVANILGGITAGTTVMLTGYVKNKQSTDPQTNQQRWETSINVTALGIVGQSRYGLQSQGNYQPPGGGYPPQGGGYPPQGGYPGPQGQPGYAPNPGPQGGYPGHPAGNTLAFPNHPQAIHPGQQHPQNGAPPRAPYNGGPPAQYPPNTGYNPNPAPAPGPGPQNLHQAMNNAGVPQSDPRFTEQDIPF